MKLSFLFMMVIALTLTSCAQDKSKTEKDQRTTAITQKIKMSIDGMVCNACQSSVKKSIKSLEGVKEVQVSLENRNAIVTYYPHLIKPEAIQQAVNKGGFTAGKPQELKQ